MFRPFKSETREKYCVLEELTLNTFQRPWFIESFYLLENHEEKAPNISSVTPTFEHYINSFLLNVRQFINPSQQQSTHQFLFNYNQPTFTNNNTPTTTFDPKKQQQLASNTIKNELGSWQTRSLRKYYLQDHQTADNLLKELRKYFDSEAITLEQQTVILYISHRFAIATCAPQFVMEVLTFGTTLLQERLDSSTTTTLTDIIPSGITHRVVKRNLGSVVTKILSLTIDISEKNCKIPGNLTGIFEELPFYITKDVKRLFETMRRYVMSRNAGNVKEKVSKSAHKYLQTVLEKNLRNMDWAKLEEANDQLVEYITSTDIGDLSNILPIHFTLVKGESNSIMYLKRLFPDTMEKEDEVENSVNAALHYFSRIMSIYKGWIDRIPNAMENSFAHFHNLSRFNFIKDFFILSTELVQNLCYFRSATALANKIINGQMYIECLEMISNTLNMYTTTYSSIIESDLWVEMENSARTNHEKLSTCHTSECWTSKMNFIQFYIGIGLLNSSIHLPDDWNYRSMVLHLGKMRKIHQEDNTSELFEKMSISDCSDSKDSFCSIPYDDPSTMFSRIFPDEIRSIERIEEIYLELFHYPYFKEEKYPWLENLSIDQNKRQVILFTLCSVLKAMLLHCGSTLDNDDLRKIHTEVESVISFKKNTNDYNSLHPKDLRNLLKDVLLHADQLVQINTLNAYYKTIEEGHESEYFVPVKDVLEAIFHKKNHFNEMFRLGTLANSFSRHLDMFLDNNLVLKPYCLFFNMQHVNHSLLFNLESCGIEVFQNIIFKLLNIHARYEVENLPHSVQEKIKQILSSLKSEYYRNIVMKCVLETVVRIYFNLAEDNSDIFKVGLITRLSEDSCNRMLEFYLAILKTGFKDSRMSIALASHAVTSFRNYLFMGGAIPYDSRMMFILDPYLFSSRACAEIISQQSDLMELILRGKFENNLHYFLFLMFKSSILKLAFDHTITNQDIMLKNLSNYGNLFLEIVNQGLEDITTNQDFQSIYDNASNMFYRFSKSKQVPDWSILQQITDKMYLYFSRYWLLQSRPDILNIKGLRQSILTLEDVNVLRSDYYSKEFLNPDSLICELTNDLYSDNNLLLKPTIWLIGAVEAFAENSITNPTLYFNLFEASIKRLANNNTDVGILVLLCRFLIKRSNTWESYLAQNISSLNESNLKVNLEKIMKSIDSMAFKKTSITLHKYCIDLFQMVYITANKCLCIPDAVKLLHHTPLSTQLYNEQGETPFFKSFNTLIHSLKSNLASLHNFSQTYNKALELDQSIAMRISNGQSLIPVCKYIQLLLQSPMAEYIIRNTNFSLFYSNSNSKLLLLPFIKKTITFTIKKKALLAELNIFSYLGQDIVPSAYLFLSKTSVTKKPIPFNFETFLQDPINVFKQHIGNMKLGYASGYAYLLPVEKMHQYDSNMMGIANIVVLNIVCEHIHHVLPKLTNPSDIATCYFVMGCLLGSSLLCKYYLGPLNIDHEVIQSFVDGISIPQGSPKFEMANSFVTGLRSVLGDDLANFLKIFTAQELISLTCDGNMITHAASKFLNDRVQCDGECRSEAGSFLNLLDTVMQEDTYLATLLVNYLDAIFSGFEDRQSYELVIIPSSFSFVQINRTKKIVEFPIRQSKEELRKMLWYCVLIMNENQESSSETTFKLKR